MHEGAGRRDVMEELAFSLEGSFRRGEVAILEQAVGTDQIPQPDLDVGIASPDMVDAEPAFGIGMAKGEYAR